MKKKILLAILLVVILLGAGFAYAYFATDAFRTEKEMFFTYISEDDIWKSLQDEKVTQYAEKQQNTPFTNKGEIALNIAGDSATAQDESIATLNNSKITIEGKVDASKKLMNQTLTADVGMGVNIPVNLRIDGETLGIQSNLLYNKYIAVRNENLKQLLEKFNINAEDVPDKIDFSQEQFTQEEIQTLKNKYFSIVNEYLSEEYFSKEKVNNQTIITLAIPEQKCVDILVKILETARNDELLLSKMSGTFDKEEFETEIDDMIEELKETETSETNSLEIKIYVESKDVKKYEMAVMEDNVTISHAVIENTENQIMIKIYEESELIAELNISTESNENDITYIVTMKTYDEHDGNIELTFNIKYKNIVALDDVEEIYDLKISYEETDEYGELTGEETEVSLNINNILKFSSELEIEGLNEENAVVLNDATEQELQNLILTIYQNLGLMQ